MAAGLNSDARHEHGQVLREDLRLKFFKPSTVLSNHVSRRQDSCCPGCLVSGVLKKKQTNKAKLIFLA